MGIAWLFFDGSGRPRSGWRFAIFCLGFLLVISILGFAIGVLPKSIPIDGSRLLSTGAMLAAALLVGWLCGRYLEGLDFKALGAWFTKGWLVHLILGIVIGTGTLLLAVLLARIFGGLSFEMNAIDGTTLLRGLAVSFAVLAVAAASEEALFRGYIFQTFVRSRLAWLAIALTSLFFAAVHIQNPAAGPVSTLNTVLAGIWFGIAYLKTRDLWFVFGLHLMWNWMQGALFGIEISGMTDLASTPLLKEIDAGPAWLTGETYGLEGGIVTTIAIIVSTVVIYFLPMRKADS